MEVAGKAVPDARNYSREESHASTGECFKCAVSFRDKGKSV